MKIKQAGKSEFPDTRALIKYSVRFANGSVLDLGAGQAKHKSIITEKCPDYTTIDVVPGPFIDVVGDIEHTPFPNESFDTIYCTQVLEHVRRPWIVAEEIYRLLKPGGIAIISVPFMQGYHADPHDYFRYTLPGLESLFGEPKYELIESGAFGGFWSVVVDSIRKIFFSAYTKPKPFSWRFNQIMLKIGRRLDHFDNSEIIYLSVYAIVRKT